MTTTNDATKDFAFYAYDFDGVLCDSAQETGLSAIKAYKSLVEVKDNELDVKLLVTGFVQIRPVLHTGWEAVAMIHLLHQGLKPAEIISNFRHSLLADALQVIGAEAKVKAAFASARQNWIAENMDEWLASHNFYTEAVATVAKLLTKPKPLYIITTKAKEFTIKLLKAVNLDVPEDRIYGLGSGPKPEVLSQIMAKHGGPCVFVEDRVKTLVDVINTDSVRDMTTMILADWGYNTEADRETAISSGKIQVFSQAQHHQFLVE